MAQSYDAIVATLIDQGIPAQQAHAKARELTLQQSRDDAWRTANYVNNQPSRRNAPIGVPDNYVAVSSQNPYQTSVVIPRYKVGDETTIPQMWNTNDTRSWQTFLMGFANGSGSPAFQNTVNVPGMWGRAESQTMAEVMRIANERGWTIDQTRKWIEGEMKANPKGWAGALGMSGGGYGGGSSPDGTTSSTNRQINLTSISEGRQLLENMLADIYGRKPTDAEVSGYVRQLNAAERKAPSITTSTTTVSGNGTRSSTSSTTTPSKVDPLKMAEDRFGGNEKTAYGEAKYMDIIAGMVGLG